MEIKTSLAKPLWVTHMLADLNIRRNRFSKYGTELKIILKYKNPANGGLTQR